MLYIACIQYQTMALFGFGKPKMNFFCAPKDYNLSLDPPAVIASYENSLNGRDSMVIAYKGFRQVRLFLYHQRP